MQEEILEKEKPSDKMTTKENVWQIIKFTLFSMVAGAIQLGVFTLLNEVWHLEYWTSYLIALTCSVLYNFTINRKFTFKAANNVPIAMTLYFIFYLWFTPYSTWLTDTLSFMNEYLVLFLNMVQNLILEYLWCRFIIYRKSINTNKNALKNKAKKNEEISE